MDIQWNTFRTLPPLKQNVLIWRGLADSDGGFPLIGRRYADTDTGETYMLFKYGSTSPHSGGYIFSDEFAQCRWAEIPMPAAARKKWEREQERMKRNDLHRR